jgi:hypothetical protein
LSVTEDGRLLVVDPDTLAVTETRIPTGFEGAHWAGIRHIRGAQARDEPVVVGLGLGQIAVVNPETGELHSVAQLPAPFGNSTPAAIDLFVTEESRVLLELRGLNGLSLVLQLHGAPP